MNRKAVVFIGGIGNHPNSIAVLLSNYIHEQLSLHDIDAAILDSEKMGIPLLNFSSGGTPKSVEAMAQQMVEADFHIWLTPLYHGSIPGVMKNSLDWLEITAKHPKPYLSDKTVGLICWGDGMQSMQGINAMDSIVKALRAWSAPYSVPMVSGDIFDKEDPKKISEFYAEKINRLVDLVVKTAIERRG